MGIVPRASQTQNYKNDFWDLVYKYYLYRCFTENCIIRYTVGQKNLCTLMLDFFHYL